MVGDPVGIEIGVAGLGRRVRIGLVQPRGAGAERAVDEDVTGQSVRPGLGEQRACLLGGVHRDAPVRAHRDAVLESEQFA